MRQRRRTVWSAAAKRAGVPLTVLNFRDPNLRELYGAPLALIRPDQYVAWRGGRAGDPDRIMAILRGAHLNEALTSELRERTA